MRKSQMLVVGLAVVAGYVLAIALNRPTAGQPPAVEALPAPSGRRVAIPHDRHQRRGFLPAADPDRHDRRSLLAPRQQPPG